MATHCSILTWEAHGQSGLAGYSLWGHKESDTTEQQLPGSHGKVVVCEILCHRARSDGQTQEFRSATSRGQLGDLLGLLLGDWDSCRSCSTKPGTDRADARWKVSPNLHPTAD